MKKALVIDDDEDCRSIAEAYLRSDLQEKLKKIFES